MSRLTIAGFTRLYPDNESCLQELAKRKFGEDFLCPVDDCGRKLYRKSGRKVWRCNDGHEVSPLAGTIFHKSRTDLRTWFFTMYLMTETRAGISAKQVQRMTGVTYKTAWRMMMQIRTMMGDDTVMEGSIEVDETFFQAKSFRDTRVSRVWKPRIVLGFIERETGRALVRVIPSVSRRELEAMVLAYVKEGSVIHSDGGMGYRHLVDLGYDHRPVVHWKPNGRDTGFHFMPSKESQTQNIENFWGNLKRGLAVYRHWSSRYLQLYAQEYAWRYTHRKSEVGMFELLLEKTATIRLAN